MTPNEYQRLAARTECDQNKSVDRMAGHTTQTFYVDTPVRLNHSVIGLAGEVGELASLIQKWIYYGKQYDPEELKKQFMLEFGDALWYIAEGLNALGLDMGQVMEANIAKLKMRYPEKYEDVLAEDANRNRQKEEEWAGRLLKKPYDDICKHCNGTGVAHVSNNEGGTDPGTCGMCSGQGHILSPRAKEERRELKNKAFASIYGDPRPKTLPVDHPNPFGYNDPIPTADPKSIDGEEDIHQVKTTVGIGRFQEPAVEHMGRNPPKEGTEMSWEQKLLSEPLKPNGCEKCHGSGYHRYPDFKDGTPNFSDSAPCSYCDGKGVKS